MTLIGRLRTIVGDGGLLTEPEDLVGYRGDLTDLAGGAILGAVRPRSTEEVSEVVRACAASRVPITIRGGGSGLAGGAVPGDGPEVVLSLERLRRVRRVDLTDEVLEVEAGCPLAEAQAVAARHGRHLGWTHGGAGASQIGGNLATNAGGNTVLRYGMARDQVLGLEVVLADGTILSDLSALRKNNAGCDLKQLFLGTEGTLGVITAALLRLRPAPVSSATVCLGIDSPAAAVELLGQARRAFGEAVSAFELMPRAGLALHLRQTGSSREPFPTPTPWLLLMDADATSRHFDLDAASDEFVTLAMDRGLARDGTVAAGEAQRQGLWRMREGIALAMIDTPGALKSDTAVPVSRIAAFVAEATEAVARIAPGAVPVPFGHVGDGNIHFNVLPPPGGAVAAFRALHPDLSAAIEDCAVALGGTVSAEHGIGRLKRHALARMLPPERLAALAALKACLDPCEILNPGKVLPDGDRSGRRNRPRPAPPRAGGAVRP